MTQSRIHIVLILLPLSLVGACDSVQPDSSSKLVLEGFFDADHAMPVITIRRTLDLSAAQEAVGAAMVPDAELEVLVNGVSEEYESSSSRPGRYVPKSSSAVVREGDRFLIEARWRGQVASGTGEVPPAVRLDSILLNVPELPVEAVLVDSLRLDSLGIDAQTGYLYPIEATLWWQSDGEEDVEYWVQAQLKPFTEFSSLVVDFFLLPEQVFPEAEAAHDGGGTRTWTGLYAVPVSSADSPLPPHSLRLAALRSGRDYAEYIRSRSSPERREPTSNLQGALGIVAGISVDSLVIELDETYAGKRIAVSADER